MNSVAAKIEAYLNYIRVERALSLNTLKAYRYDLKQYGEFLEAVGTETEKDLTPVRQPEDITARHIMRYIDAFASTTGTDGNTAASTRLTPRSIARKITAIRSLHAFWTEENIVPENAAVHIKPPAPKLKLPKTLNIQEVGTILAAASSETLTGLRDRALLELLYATGARISEIVGLNLNDVDPAMLTVSAAAAGRENAAAHAQAEEPGIIRLRGKGAKERFVPVGSYAAAALTGYLVRARPALAGKKTNAETPALFLNARGGRLSRQSAWTILKETARKAGVDADISPHTLRHCCATHMLQGGADVRVVQELLGHASVSTTQIYTLVTVDTLREVYATAHPRAL